MGSREWPGRCSGSSSATKVGLASIADAHCDTLMLLTGEHPVAGSLTENLPGHLDLPRMLEAGVGLQFFALFTEPSHGPGLNLRRILEMIAAFHRSVAMSEGRLRPVLTAHDVAPQEGSVAGLLAVEGLSAIAGSVEVLESLHMLGVRSAMLTWNERNDLADGALDQGSGGGLSVAGKAIVRAMQRLHMVLDVSHLGEKGFWDLLDASEGPFIASHSNARSLCEHPRNLRDEQLKALASRGGVAGMNFYSGFIVADGPAKMDDLMRHIGHIADLVGPQHIGLGSDFDGIHAWPEGLGGVQDYPNLRQALAKAGFSDAESEGILGGNLRRVLAEVLA